MRIANRSTVGLVLASQFATAALAAVYTAQQIADMIRASPTAPQIVKDNADLFGATAIAESGGNTLDRNGQNGGLLQLDKQHIKDVLGDTATVQDYTLLDGQTQIDKWAEATASEWNYPGMKTLLAANKNGDAIGGAKVTPGMVAACFQFGPAICQNDIAYMKANGGACPDKSTGVNINTLSGSGQKNASLDGNGQSICSWGAVIDKKAGTQSSTDTAKAATSVDCPTPEGASAAASIASGDFQKYTGQYWGQNQECASLTKYFDPSLGAASTWRKGEQVQGNASIQPGTPIATFNFGDAYGPSDSPGGASGVSHTGIYLGQNAEGVQILDQWNGSGGASAHTIPWHSWNGNAAEAGNRYYTITH
jgi:hypothetical protein